MITILGLQEVDNMTREKIQDELKELKEAHAADEGTSFLLLSYQFYHYIYMPHLWSAFLVATLYFMSCPWHFVGNLT